MPLFQVLELFECERVSLVALQPFAVPRSLARVFGAKKYLGSLGDHKRAAMTQLNCFSCVHLAQVRRPPSDTE